MPKDERIARAHQAKEKGRRAKRLSAAISEIRRNSRKVVASAVLRASRAAVLPAMLSWRHRQGSHRQLNSRCSQCSHRISPRIQLNRKRAPGCRDSISIPIVIRDGKPCGLNRISGVSPPSVNGMSSPGQRTLITPPRHSP